MFLKRLLIALLAANIGYFAYSHGWLANVAGSEVGQREPDRLKKQINTGALRIESLSAASDAPPAPPIAAPVGALTAAPLATTPAQSCAAKSAATETWFVYMGPYANKELLTKKQTELAKLNVTAQEVSKTSLSIGLSLGSYPSEALARQALQALAQNGVRTATVVLWSTNPATPATQSAAAAANCPA